LLDETRELLEADGLALSDQAVRSLHDRTEGWAAGLRLAAMSMERHPDPERFVTEFCGSERMISDYLLAEVLDRRPPEVREMLPRTPTRRRSAATCLRRVDDASTCASSTHGSVPRSDELSPAELRVLGYLPSTLKADEIAAELYLSANTVRTHIRHIHAKLDAHTRAEAVARARERELLVGR
jgi:ATP/maltotriose-dependent transcriptional regulator MalT